MRWLRLVGSLKSYVSFAKEPYKRDDILRKRPIFLRSLLTVATPYAEDDGKEEGKDKEKLPNVSVSLSKKSPISLVHSLSKKSPISLVHFLIEP